MPTGFSQVLASIEPCAGPGFSVTVPPDWLQGRTVFGGMQMALGGRAMRAVLPLQAAAMPLRSAQMTFVGPLLGGAPIRMKAETLRAANRPSMPGATSCTTMARWPARSLASSADRANHGS